jgi:cell division protein ZapD
MKQAAPPPRILYEHPFSEGVRTMLRLEHLLDRLARLVERDEALDHHFALQTLFEVQDLASRADLKTELLKELERHKAQYQGYRGHPEISEASLDALIARIDAAVGELQAAPAVRSGASPGHDVLSSVRNRIGIAGGTCCFDLPGYHAWQHLAGAQRRADLVSWIEPLAPLAQALALQLGLLRDSGMSQRVRATAGQFQQKLPDARTWQLVRLHIVADLGLVPEISGQRSLVSVRMLRFDADGRLKPVAEDADFDLTLCA